MNDPVYKETVENAASYNSRLSSERTMRLPFLDSQTGVAQNHSNLFMDPRQRLPGLREGQIYTYPSKRWRKKRRQYLINFMQPRYPVRTETKEEDQISTVSAEISPFPPPSAPIGFSEDSKDSTKDETKPVRRIMTEIYTEINEKMFQKIDQIGCYFIRSGITMNWKCQMLASLKSQIPTLIMIMKITVVNEGRKSRQQKHRG